MSKKKKKKNIPETSDDDFIYCPPAEDYENPFISDSVKGTRVEDDDQPPVPEYSRPAAKQARDFLMTTPKCIYDLLDKNVFGHDTYKRELSTLLWKAYHHKKPGGALLVAGASGSGKTEMLRCIKDIYRNMVIVDGTRIVPAGYRGASKLSTHFKSLSFAEDAAFPVYVIDEFDKTILRGKSDGWSGSSLMMELLKLMEGCSINVGDDMNPVMQDIRNTYFILLGAFSFLTERKKTAPIGFLRQADDASPSTALTEQAIMNSMPFELQGRIERTVILDPLTEDDFKRIIHGKYSPVVKLANELQISIGITEAKADEIAHNAYMSRSVRTISHEVSRIVNDYLFDHPHTDHIYID